MMEFEHDSATAALRRIRELTGNFQAPAHACQTYRGLWERLERLESDLHRHIHLENDILFPRAAAIEAANR
jgi:regulator of cell morphogenesis and NO signaling